jgi:AcrR family transcriptional regulator
MPYTPEHKARTRERIVESAQRLFNRHGFNGVSIDEIMADAGLTRGGFYNHFGTKDELYAEVVTYALSSRREQAAKGACAQPRTAREFISALPRAGAFRQSRDLLPADGASLRRRPRRRGGQARLPPSVRVHDRKFGEGPCGSPGRADRR